MKILVDSNLLVYLNARMPSDDATVIEKLWEELLRKHELFTNVLVLDEVLYISKKKYDIPYNDTLEFIDKAVLPYVTILSIGVREYFEARAYMLKYDLKPSDALHVATIITSRLDAIVSEDRDFDRTGIKRIWI